MAESNEVAVISREAKFRDAALVLADDVAELAGKLRSCIRGRKYERAEGLAAQVRRTARDATWLLQRLPKDEEREP